MFGYGVKLAKVNFLKSVSDIKLSLYVLVDFENNYPETSFSVNIITKYERMLVEAKNSLEKAIKKLAKNGIIVPVDFSESLRLVEPGNFIGTSQLQRYFGEIDERVEPFE